MERTDQLMSTEDETKHQENGSRKRSSKNKKRGNKRKESSSSKVETTRASTATELNEVPNQLNETVVKVPPTAMINQSLSNNFNPGTGLDKTIDANSTLPIQITSGDIKHNISDSKRLMNLLKKAVDEDLSRRESLSPPSEPLTTRSSRSNSSISLVSEVTPFQMVQQFDGENKGGNDRVINSTSCDHPTTITANLPEASVTATKETITTANKTRIGVLPDESTNVEKKSLSTVLLMSSNPSSVIETETESTALLMSSNPSSVIETETESTALLMSKTETEFTALLHPVDTAVCIVEPDESTSRKITTSAVHYTDTDSDTVPHSPLDAFVDGLISGQHQDVRGLVIVCGWSWSKPGSQAWDAYNAIYEAIRQLDVLQQYFYLYKPSELHCTVATLSSFKAIDSFLSMAPENLRKAFFIVWKEAFMRAITASSRKLSSFQLIIERIQITDNCCIFHFSDPSDMIASIRDCVRCAATDPLLTSFESLYGLCPGECNRHMHIPDIIHSTFIRFRTDLSEQMLQELKNICSSWKPLSIE
eukprot:gene9704-20177_t